MFWGMLTQGRRCAPTLGQLNDCNPFGIASGGDDGQIFLKAMQTLTDEEKIIAQVNPEVPVKKVV